MRVQDGEAEMEAVDVACSRHNSLVDQYNSIVTERNELHRKLEKLGVELDAQTQQLATVVLNASKSQYATVRAFVADLHKAMLRDYPEAMAEQENESAVTTFTEETVVVERPVQRQQTTRRRPNGTIARRPSRPQRPKEIE